MIAFDIVWLSMILALLIYISTLTDAQILHAGRWVQRIIERITP